MISVVRPGLLTTVQDAGRPGFRASGLPVAGAMDRLAWALANCLAGNPPGAAALEMTLLGGSFRFERAGLVALAGADMQARLDGEPVETWSAFRVGKGSELVLGSAPAGARAYLAVRGGIDVPQVLGSRSTYARAAIGGLEGRALRAGDRLPVGKPPGGGVRPGRLPAALVPACGGDVGLRVLLGPQDDRFEPEGIATFFSASYQVTNRNDRMGYQLEGPRIRHRDGADIVSDGLCPGAVQVPGSGVPIVMAMDAQTTGGYAKIATVIGADLRLLAQARTGDRIRFAACTDADAVAALRRERTTVSRAAAYLERARR